MTTKTTEQIVTVQPPNYNNCNLEESFMEQKRFNSGPQASKTLPNLSYRPTNIDLAPPIMEVDEQEDRPLSSTQPPASSSANSDSLCLLATSESLSSRTPPPTNQQNFLPAAHPLNTASSTPFPYSTPPSAQHQPGNSNDSSNLSNGGSGSDKELETANKPTSQPPITSLPSTPEASTTKAPRKRKTTEKTTPRTPRTKVTKIHDFYKDSQAANNINSNVPLQNGDNPTNDLYTAGTSQTRTNDNSTSECVVESTTGSSTLYDSRLGEINHLNKQIDRLKMDLGKEMTRVKSYKEVIRELLVEKSKVDRLKAREKSSENQVRIGRFRPMRTGDNFKEQWHSGNAFEELDRRVININRQKTELQNAQQNLRKQKPTKASKKAANSDAPTNDVSNPSPLGRQNSTPTIMDEGFVRPELPRHKEMSSQDVYEQEEIMKLRKEHLRKEELELQNEKERLDRERNLHVREMKRIQCEDQSRFKNFEVLHKGRYLLSSLLGKGGFSEVWRAYDLEENRYVACKIHHVNKDWKEDKKANYVKHAMREKDIHRSLNHPRIVRLFDVFSIDSDSFCTVLEYCDGNDLDFYLKQHKQMNEKEARSIIMQIVSALKYLSERPNPIIHYDLKPANILLQSGSAVGEIKITDFGLSKQLENADDESIELTSQGAGTYWYLPPETFQYSGYGAPKISSKVDVWSLGVITYQCLYGKKPFGHDRTQQEILEERIILSANQVDFPNNARISQPAQDFIRACLQYDKDERADVNQLFQHEFLKKKNATTTTTSS